jgi:folate-binding protein YgfZ
MEKDQTVILEDRGIISVSGTDATDFLQNILSNDIDKVDNNKSIYSAILTPQGKYLYDFFIIKYNDAYFLDCDYELTKEIIEHLFKYKLRSKLEIKDISSEYVVGIISLEKFKEIQINEKKNEESILYRGSPLFIDPRKKQLGARLLSSLEKLHLTIKKLNLKIIDNINYLEKAHMLGVPIKGTKLLKDKLFGLEANFEKFNAIDFKKGCYVGQENTARMKLKDKVRKRLLPIQTKKTFDIGSEIIFKKITVGKLLISEPYAFALIKLKDPDLKTFINEELYVNEVKVKILNKFLD